MIGCIRITHPDRSLWGHGLLVPHPGDAERAPTRFLVRLDNDGYGYITPLLWRQLQECTRAGLPHGLVYASELARGPKQQIGLLPPTVSQITEIDRRFLACPDGRYREVPITHARQTVTRPPELRRA